jgi:hypothetical protein
MMDRPLISPFDSAPLMSVVPPWRRSTLCTGLFPQTRGFVRHPPPQQTCSPSLLCAWPSWECHSARLPLQTPQVLIAASSPPCSHSRFPQRAPWVVYRAWSLPPLSLRELLIYRAWSLPSLSPLLRSLLVVPPRACLYNWALCRTHKNRPILASPLATVKCNRSIYSAGGLRHLARRQLGT